MFFSSDREIEWSNYLDIYFAEQPFKSNRKGSYNPEQIFHEIVWRADLIISVSTLIDFLCEEHVHWNHNYKLKLRILFFCVQIGVYICYLTPLLFFISMYFKNIIYSSTLNYLLCACFSYFLNSDGSFFFLSAL